jgi:hypothetical protein
MRRKLTTLAEDMKRLGLSIPTKPAALNESKDEQAAPTTPTEEKKAAEVHTEADEKISKAIDEALLDEVRIRRIGAVVGGKFKKFKSHEDAKQRLKDRKLRRIHKALLSRQRKLRKNKSFHKVTMKKRAMAIARGIVGKFRATSASRLGKKESVETKTGVIAEVRDSLLRMSQIQLGEVAESGKTAAAVFANLALTLDEVAEFLGLVALIAESGTYTDLACIAKLESLYAAKSAEDLHAIVEEKKNFDADEVGVDIVELTASTADLVEVYAEIAECICKAAGVSPESAEADEALEEDEDEDDGFVQMEEEGDEDEDDGEEDEDEEDDEDESPWGADEFDYDSLGDAADSDEAEDEVNF